MKIYHLLIALFILYLVLRAIQKRAYHHPENEGLQNWRRIATGLFTVAFFAYMYVVVPKLLLRILPGGWESTVDHETSDATNSPIIDEQVEDDQTRTLSDFLLPPLPSWSDNH